jgi:polyhydroxyalkanoate synthesis regulator phasin
MLAMTRKISLELVVELIRQHEMSNERLSAALDELEDIQAEFMLMQLLVGRLEDLERRVSDLE